MLEKSVDNKLVYKHRQNDDILFTVNMSVLDGPLIYVVAGKYNMKTGKCECTFMPQMKNLERRSYEGEKRTCEHYPNGNCEIITEEIKSEK